MRPAELGSAEQTYATALAVAIAADAAAHPPPGPLHRAVIRWFWESDPLYLTIHLLGEDDEQPEPDDAWYPLEWAAVDRELERTDRVLAEPALQAAGAALAKTFPPDGDGQEHLPAVTAAVRLLPEALRASGVEVAERFAVSAAHFEGWGARDVLDATAEPGLLAELATHDKLPEE